MQESKYERCSEKRGGSRGEREEVFVEHLPASCRTPGGYNHPHRTQAEHAPEHSYRTELQVVLVMRKTCSKWENNLQSSREDRVWFTPDPHRIGWEVGVRGKGREEQPHVNHANNAPSKQPSIKAVQRRSIEVVLVALH